MAFEGKLLRPGAAIDDAELWPGEEWPAVPLLLECAGRDFAAPMRRIASGFGGKRRPIIHILWRYERRPQAQPNGSPYPGISPDQNSSTGSGEWRELVRASSVDNDWIAHFAAIARLELRRGVETPPLAIAERALARCVEAMDRELQQLQGEELILALGFLYEQVAARVVKLDQCA
jgi:hypothetical protein